MDVNEHERLSNIILGHKFKQRRVCSKKEYGCKLQAVPLVELVSKYNVE
jgi:hypothetical protein